MIFIIDMTLPRKVVRVPKKVQKKVGFPVVVKGICDLTNIIYDLGIWLKLKK